MRALYTLFIYSYTLSIRVVSPFNKKAKLWVQGRKGWKRRLKGIFKEKDQVYWFHCASLGEFEQGRPLIEKLRQEKEGIKILLTFFSPSGYEVRKDFELADHVMYLPSDTPSNARVFMKLVKPEKAIFIKYEFWYNYLLQAKKSSCKLYIISALFRRSQPFFRWYGGLSRKALHSFSHLFIQDDASGKLLDSIGISNYTVCGDTRFDRVYSISRQSAALPVLANFKSNHTLIIAGSSWPAEEEIISSFVNSRNDSTRWIIAPHQIDQLHLEKIESLFQVPVIRYSGVSDGEIENARVLIIDNFGMLSSAYRYADIAIVGGGFGKGIHNILEPATWGIPVIFGPNYTRFREAHGLLDNGGGFSFSGPQDFENIMDSLLDDESRRISTGRKSSLYVEMNLGATDQIFDRIS